MKSSLFGIQQSNRDFALKEAWGKNQFNSSFPAALCCYLDSKDIGAVYLSITKQKFQANNILIKDVFGLEPTNPDIYQIQATKPRPSGQRYLHK